jgi:virginiamycin B lyase
LEGVMMAERLPRADRGRSHRLIGAFSIAAVSVVAFGVVGPGHAIAGPVTEFAVPSLDAAPAGVAQGPGGTTWFAESTGLAVGRIDSSGNVKEFPVPANSSGSYGSLNSITPGPDGAIWFTEVAPDAIGRLDPATGAITLHRVHSALGTAAPVGITTGPDGALWFTESGTSVIGRLDPSTGKITTTKTKTPGAVPLGIVSGPDGGVWFTEAAAGNVGRVDPVTHKVHEYRLSGALDAPLQITVGWDRALWVSEAGVDRIARCSVPSSARSSARRTTCR